MRFIETFDLWPFLDTVVSLAAAFLFGTAIGAERQYRQRTAGLRTNVLVAVGAAAFVDLAMRIAGPTEATRVVSYVVSGIGFLGAGVIMKEGMNVRGLNTAATLWCAAAVGACAGADMVAEAGLLTLFVIVGNTLLRPLVNAINRRPIDERASEATYEISLAAAIEDLPRLRELLADRMEQAHYPAGDIALRPLGEESGEVVATLLSTAVNPPEMDALVAGLERLPGVTHATWAMRTSD
ncbi:MgtC/SapB family protein [Roseomonas gilardii subsp. gilardii]|uniref:MgtC/SapB family protein n=1 Tax=Roseomonas gilardii TaxID=257708 RepID=UPI001FF9A81F|nr:MgtC/SapB family protein [Roseomonas gilardii]UPG71771.1 MgtC/SapB family protein [Roseomonas gilardii subsp. gilardii]